MAKTMLNQTVSRPILYAYAQEQIAKTPSKWLGEKKKAINEFLATIPKIKQIVTDKISNLTPQEDLDVLAKYDMTEQESCFWFTDTESKDARQDKNSIYANFACNGYGNSYYYNSSRREVGNLSTDDLIAIYYEDMVANGIDVVKYKFVQDNNCDYNGKRINTYHREHVASQLGISGWMGQSVRFDNEAAKIRFACKSNNRKQLTHNNTSGKDVETSVRKVLELENTFTKEAIKYEVEDLGWHLSSTTRDKIINTLLVEFTVSGKTKSGEDYTPHNADTIWRLLEEIDDSWVEDYWTNDEQTTLAIHMANFESRVGSLLSSSSTATNNRSPLNLIFSVTVPKGKETLDSKREKVFSTFIPSVEDRMMITMGLGERHRDMFPWNHPDAEHRFVAQDNNKEKPDVLIKIKNRNYN